MQMRIDPSYKGQCSCGAEATVEHLIKLSSPIEGKFGMATITHMRSYVCANYPACGGLNYAFAG